MNTHTRLSRSVLPTLLLSLLSVACSDVPATNPYDPDTPVAQQAKASIRGVVTLPPGDEDLSVFQMGKIALYALQDVPTDSSVCASSSLEAATRLGEISAPDSSGGQFEIADIEAGLYTIAACVQGYRPATKLIELDRSASVTVDLKLARADVSQLSSAIVGLVRLEGQMDDGHGGVRIEAVGREFATVSTSEGRFTLPIPPGDYTIRFLPKATKQSRYLW